MAENPAVLCAALLSGSLWRAVWLLGLAPCRAMGTIPIFTILVRTPLELFPSLAHDTLHPFIFSTKFQIFPVLNQRPNGILAVELIEDSKAVVGFRKIRFQLDCFFVGAFRIVV